MGKAAARPAAGSVFVHVGRQPILDAHGRLYGYELLFRGSAEAKAANAPARGAGADAATTMTIVSAFSEFGSQLLGGRLGFVNLTRAFIVGELPVPFAPNAGVLEVLETVEIDDEVVEGAACRVAEGHRLALDDFVWSEQAAPLLELADIVKVDVLGMTWDEVLETVERCRRYDVRMLAERVEDPQMLEQARAAGFELFQGYHLGRPQTLTMERLEAGQAVALRLLARLADPQVRIADVETVLRTDPALCMRLLHIANGAQNGLRRRVSSIKDAVTLVGLARLRAWMVLIATERGAGNREQVKVALIRARTCELTAPSVPSARPETAFTLGLLHGVAEALGLPIETFLAGLPALSDELRAPLTGQPGPLRTVLDAVLRYESADDPLAVTEIGPLGELAGAYLAALAWTSQTVAGAES